MTITSIEMVFYTFIFLVPGYFIHEIIGTIMPNKNYAENIKFLRYLSYSIINCAIWSWVYMIILNHIGTKTVLYWILIVIITIFSSIITGIVMGIIRKNEIIRKMFIKMGIQIEHPIPTAWDYKFSEIKEARWIIVRLCNDEKIYGKYSTKSLSSSDTNNYDLYLEEVYTYVEGQPWKIVERTDGIWINSNEIKSIEFKI